MSKQLISLLCRKKTKYSNKLKKKLNNKNNFVEEIEDNNQNFENCINYNFYNLVTIKSPSAWEASFYNIFINKLNKKYKYFYFIEDDVYSKNVSTFNILINNLNNIHCDLISSHIMPKYKMLEWPHWETQDVSMFNEEDLYFSFNPLCRLSNRLIDEVFQFQFNNNKFIFHEILFASLCKKNKMKSLSLEKKTKALIGEMKYRPVIEKGSTKNSKIYHPVKFI